MDSAAIDSTVGEKFETKDQRKMAMKRRDLGRVVGKVKRSKKEREPAAELVSHTNWFLVCMGMRRERKEMEIASICLSVSDMNTTMQYLLLRLGISLM